MQEDPAGFGGGYSNLHVYVGNDPTNLTDPTGMWGEWLQKAWDYTGGLVKDVVSLSIQDPSNIGTFAGAAREGAAVSGQGIINGVKETGNIARDIPQIAIGAGSLVTDKVAGTGIYQVNLNSKLFGGMAIANRNGQAAQYYVSTVRSMGTLGLYDLGQAGYEAYQQKDAGILGNAVGQMVGGTLAAGGTAIALRSAGSVIVGKGPATPVGEIGSFQQDVAGPGATFQKDVAGPSASFQRDAGSSVSISKPIGPEPQVIGKVAPPTDLRPGTTLFGDEMHARIAQWLQERYPNVEFRFRVGPRQRGVDVEVIRGDPGFKYADIKPKNAFGKTKLANPVDKWKLKDVKPITYDAAGNIYEGF